ncbi:MAG: hypothetical protein M1823_006209, partial [Watsoniomyces obsoletus]
ENVEKDFDADTQASRGQQRAGSDNEAPVTDSNLPPRSRQQGAQRTFLDGLEDYASSAKSNRQEGNAPPDSRKRSLGQAGLSFLSKAYILADSSKSAHPGRCSPSPQPRTVPKEPRNTVVEDRTTSLDGEARGGLAPGLRNRHERYKACAAAKLASRGVPALDRRAKDMADAEGRREAEKKREDLEVDDQRTSQNTRPACGRTTVIYYCEPGSDCVKMTPGILFDTTLEGLREVAQRPADAVVGRFSHLTGTYVRGQRPTKDTHRKGAVVGDSDVRFCYRLSRPGVTLMFLIESDEARSLKVDEGTVDVERDGVRRLVPFGSPSSLLTSF